MKNLIAPFTKLIMLSGLLLSFSVFAESTDKPSPPNAPDSTSAKDVNGVFIFNRVCYGRGY